MEGPLQMEVYFGPVLGGRIGVSFCTFEWPGGAAPARWKAPSRRLEKGSQLEVYLEPVLQVCSGVSFYSFQWPGRVPTHTSRHARGCRGQPLLDGSAPAEGLKTEQKWKPIQDQCHEAVMECHFAFWSCQNGSSTYQPQIVADSQR